VVLSTVWVRPPPPGPFSLTLSKLSLRHFKKAEEFFIESV
jgi:hypothetical protein